MHFNFFKGTGQLIRLDNYPYEPVAVQDFRNNYWGTTDTDSLDAWIWDGHDDPSVHSVVEYMPMADGPVPIETSTWGDVKAMFRGGN